MRKFKVTVTRRTHRSINPFGKWYFSMREFMEHLKYESESVWGDVDVPSEITYDDYETSWMAIDAAREYINDVLHRNIVDEFGFRIMQHHYIIILTE